jgi:hypothetical protein
MNIASNEDSSIDITGRWINQDQCHITINLEQDGMGETEIDYAFDLADLVFLRDIITEFIDSQPGA